MLPLLRGDGVPDFDYPIRKYYECINAWRLELQVKKCFIVVERFFKVALYIVVIALRVTSKLRECMYHNQFHFPHCNISRLLSRGRAYRLEESETSGLRQ